MTNCKAIYACLLCLFITGCGNDPLHRLPDKFLTKESPAFERIVLIATQKPFPSDVALGHVSNDDSQDMVITTWGDFLGRIGPGAEIGSVTIIRGRDKEGRLFAKQVEFSAGQAAGSLALADIDGDGTPDVIVASMNAETRQLDGRNRLGQIQIFWGDGTSLIPGPKIPSPVVNPRSVEIADINGDGRPDIIVGTQSEEEKAIGVLINNGTRKLEPRKVGRLNGRGWPVRVAKLTKSGRYNDIVVLDSQSKPMNLWGLVILVGDGGGHFSQKDVRGDRGIPYSFAIGDLNSDGIPDIAVSTDRAVLLFYGDGEGNFRQDKEIIGTFAPGRLSIADLDRDGKLDIVVPTGSDELSILWGGDTNKFTGRTKLSLKSSTSNSTDDPDLTMYPIVSYAIGDIDGDGWPDIVIPATASDFAKVYQDRAASLQESVKGSDAHGYLVIFRNRLSGWKR